MEFFDVCDENGLPTGEVVSREEAHSKGIRHRTAHIWIVRESPVKKGSYDVLMQKRSSNKDSFPGRYDTSSAGHIQAGDEPTESAIRELQEELGIVATPNDLTFVKKYVISYQKEFYGKMFCDEEIAFVYIYQEPVDLEKLVLQAEEVEKVEWFDLDEVYEAKLQHDQKFCAPIEGVEIVREYLLGV